MKKALSIFLTITFLLSTIGLTFATHYCSGKLLNTRIVTHLGDDPCGCPSAPLGDDCCKDDWKILKIKNDFISGSMFSLKTEKNFNGFSFTALTVTSHQLQFNRTSYTGNHSCDPPALRDTAILSLLQVFRL